MRKIWTIAWKDLYTTFRDRNLVLIMIAAPLAVSTIVGLAFGGAGGGDIVIRDIPVAIVNQDQGSGGQNFGEIFASAFVPPAEGEAAATASDQPACPEATAPDSQSSNENVLFDLTNAIEMDDAAAARAAVDKGDYTAAIVIPPDFSQKISYGLNNPIEPVGVEVYANSGRELSAGIVRSIVESIANQIATGNIAVASTLETVGAEFGLLSVAQVASSADFGPNVACAFTPALNNLKIDQQTVAGERSNNTAAVLVLVGSAQAMFFMLFTGQGGVLSVFEERRQGTLQRLVVSPTPRLSIIIGKLVGTFVQCVVQMVFLLLALSIIASLSEGRFTFIWGNDMLSLALLVAAVALAATGLGTLLAGLAKTPEQANIYGSVINLALALLGGAFGFALPEALSRFSMLYWGTNAFQKLAANNPDIGLNLLILLAHFVIMFGVGWWLFNRRMDV